MRSIITLAAFALLLHFSGLSWSAEMPYGADALPFLARNSSVIINSSKHKMEKSPNPERISLFEISIEQVLKGKSINGKSLLVIIPNDSEKVPEKSFPPYSLWFLKGPLSPENAAEEWGIKQEGVYLIVGGHHGVVATGRENERRLSAVSEYLKIPQSKRLSWAVEHYDTTDNFLQRSAILEMADQARTDQADHAVAAINHLGNVLLKAKNVSESNRADAIHGLERSKRKEALAPLRQVAENTAAAPKLREQAVEAVAHLPGGREVLKTWTTGKDDLLATKSKQLLEVNSREEMREETATKIIKRIQGDSSDRQQAITEALKYRYSERIAGAMEEVLLAHKGTTTDSLLVIEALGQFNDTRAAMILSRIARNERLPDRERRTAIITIAKMKFADKKRFVEEFNNQIAGSKLAEFAKSVLGPGEP